MPPPRHGSGLQPAAGLMGHGPLLVLRHRTAGHCPPPAKRRRPRISDLAAVWIEAVLNIALRRARATARSGLGFGSDSPSRLPAMLRLMRRTICFAIAAACRADGESRSLANHWGNHGVQPVTASSPPSSIANAELSADVKSPSADSMDASCNRGRRGSGAGRGWRLPVSVGPLVPIDQVGIQPSYALSHEPQTNGVEQGTLYLEQIIHWSHLPPQRELRDSFLSWQASSPSCPGSRKDRYLSPAIVRRGTPRSQSGRDPMSIVSPSMMLGCPDTI